MKCTSCDTEMSSEHLKSELCRIGRDEFIELTMTCPDCGVAHIGAIQTYDLLTDND